MTTWDSNWWNQLVIQDEKAQGYEQLRKAAKVPELLILCELPSEIIRSTLQNTGTHFLRRLDYVTGQVICQWKMGKA